MQEANLGLLDSAVDRGLPLLPVAELVGVDITIVSNGPAREDWIARGESRFGGVVA